MTINVASLGAGGIKSIQRGYSAVGNVTITAVDLNKAVLIVNNAFWNGDAIIGFGRLTNSTTLVVDASNAAGLISWQVIEYV